MLVIPIDKIQTEVGNFYGVSIKEMKGSRRLQNIVLARQVAMYLSRELTDNSLPKIGKEFGGKDHTTVIHAHAKIKSLIDQDDNLRLEIESIKRKSNNLWITFSFLSFLSTFFKQAKNLI